MEFLKTMLLTAVIFFPLERVRPMHPDQKVFRRAWFNDLVFWAANSQIIGLALSVIVSGTIVLSGHLLGPSVREAVASQPNWLQFIEAVILSDIGFYFTHRAFHAIPWLWKFHSVHHSIEELDWLALRACIPSTRSLPKGVSLLPIFALGFSEVAIAAYMALYALQSVFVHSNANVKFGPLRWVLASPEFHHWHCKRPRHATAISPATAVPRCPVWNAAHAGRQAAIGLMESMR